MKMVKFKSFPENWVKEHDGRKPNTIRKKDLNDNRHRRLGVMMAADDYGTIEIENTATGEVFRRDITDVTEWDGWLIISWKHYKGNLQEANYDS